MQGAKARDIDKLYIRFCPTEIYIKNFPDDWDEDLADQKHLRKKLETSGSLCILTTIY